MVHVAFHFGLGMLAGTLAAARPVATAWSGRSPVAGPLGRALLAGYALAAWAVVPNLLRHAGCPDAWVDGWWMNLFLLHPLIRRIGFGGAPLGAAVLVFAFAVQYGLVLGAIRRTRRSD
jgi:hypothetical protein